KYKIWKLEPLPFIPDEFKYEVIPGVKKQFNTVKKLLNRKDVEVIYVCTDSGREGEYIYRLVDDVAKVGNKIKKRVWIDSQTEEEILRGIKEAKDLSEYDNLAASAYLRAKEDYLMGINFSRLLTLKYGNDIARYNNKKYMSISVGRVMTCVLGMVVRREEEIRNFKETPFYRIVSQISHDGIEFSAEWKVTKNSIFYNSPLLYKENGFNKRETAEEFVEILKSKQPLNFKVLSIDKKDEYRNAPLLFNLAELQNECSKRFKISPAQTLNVVQGLYEKKLVTYPRTDARVLSSAVAKVIRNNIYGLKKYAVLSEFADEALANGKSYNLAETKYVDDKKITDHYAIIPTGQGLNALSSLNELDKNVYELIARRFLSIFMPPAIYKKISISGTITYDSGEAHTEEVFNASFKVTAQEGYLKVAGKPHDKKDDLNDESKLDTNFLEILNSISKNDTITVSDINIKEGKTSPPKRYTSGSIILAMENAGQLIEDEELRAQIKGSGIGTSATRAEILNKLSKIGYISINKKTQCIYTTKIGEMIYIVVLASIKQLLNPELTASWEKGLTYVAEGTITSEEYMKKLEYFIRSKTEKVKNINNERQLHVYYDKIALNYKTNSRRNS
ncbi:MAG: DNA topoisomerase, partial [Eubacterium sp.]